VLFCRIKVVIFWNYSSLYAPIGFDVSFLECSCRATKNQLSFQVIYSDIFISKLADFPI